MGAKIDAKTAKNQSKIEVATRMRFGQPWGSYFPQRCHPFGSLLGAILAQKSKKRYQKIDAKIDAEKASKMMSKGFQNGAKMGPKIDNIFDLFRNGCFCENLVFP